MDERNIYWCHKNSELTAKNVGFNINISVFNLKIDHFYSIMFSWWKYDNFCLLNDLLRLLIIKLLNSLTRNFSLKILLPKKYHLRFSSQCRLIYNTQSVYHLDLILYQIFYSQKICLLFAIFTRLMTSSRLPNSFENKWKISFQTYFCESIAKIFYEIILVQFFCWNFT